MRAAFTKSILRAPSHVALFLFLLLSARPAAEAQVEGTCVPDADTLCLQSNRFSVEVDWDDTVSSGTGQVMGLGTNDTGFFYYQDPLYVELMVKVLDACFLNDRYWVFAAGLSDAIQTITVTDEVIGTVWTYDNFLGDFPTFTDTAAIPCQPPFTGPFASPRSHGTEREPLQSQTTLDPEGPPSTTLHLLEGRFQVEVDWQDFDMNTGDGIPEPITDASGVFWFVGPTNYELILKIVDNVSSTGFYSLFFAATTNVEYNVEVTDVCTGAVRFYNSPLGGPVETTVDLSAFEEGIGCNIFADGFESGDTSMWTVTVP